MSCCGILIAITTPDALLLRIPTDEMDLLGSALEPWPDSWRNVLRISVEQDCNALSFVLEGRLVGPWVYELRTVWQDRAGGQEGLPLTVDLCGLTAMDTAGQRLLDELLQRGATLRCSDVMNQYLVEQMGDASGRLQEACRPCRRFHGESSLSATETETELAS